jgi:hypothetical protein
MYLYRHARETHTVSMSATVSNRTVTLSDMRRWTGQGPLRVSLCPFEQPNLQPYHFSCSYFLLTVGVRRDSSLGMIPGRHCVAQRLIY